jgi:hypothetical protein
MQDIVLDENALISAWQDSILPFRMKISFPDAKRLSHKIFDDLGLPRPFVKSHNYDDLLGYATAEWEIFVQHTTYDDTVLHESAHLLSWSESAKSKEADGHTALWMSQYIFLLGQFASIPKENLSRFVATTFVRHTELPPAFGHFQKPIISPDLARWASLRPGDKHYEMAISAGCTFRGQVYPLRDGPAVQPLAITRGEYAVLCAFPGPGRLSARELTIKIRGRDELRRNTSAVRYILSRLERRRLVELIYWDRPTTWSRTEQGTDVLRLTGHQINVI